MEFFSATFFGKAVPLLAVIFLQFGYAGMSILSKFALNDGMSPHIFTAYRHAIATIVMAPFALYFERKTRPKMTFSIFIKILILGLLEPTIDQNLYYTGMKYTTATFATTMSNILPAFTFLMAWFLRLEKVELKKLDSQAKITGTVVAILGAMLMTLLKGPPMTFPWTKAQIAGTSAAASSSLEPIKGGLMIVSGCFCWSSFIILQTLTLESYPAELSLSVLICMAGAMEGGMVALVMERSNPSAWFIHLDIKLLAAVYSGVICSGLGYYLQGVIVRSKGPVFVSAFNPLSMLIVTIAGSFFLSETMYLGGVLGAVAIVIGLYLVLWGKRNDGEKMPEVTPESLYGYPPATQLSKVRPTLQNV